MLSRPGATLIELLVAMTLAALVLGAATSSLVRQRRVSNDHAARASAELQLRAALGALQFALDGLAPMAGDLVGGEARDTAIQLRTVVAGAVACDSGAGQVTLAADDTGVGRVSGFAAAPRTGDTAWWRAPGSPSWVARRVADISSRTGVCSVAGAGVRVLLRLGFTLPDTVPRGALVRLTRQARFSFYHAGDGSWQLGIAEWSDVLHAFAPPQPVAGPFTLIATDGDRTGFLYFDAAGTELPVGAQGVPVASVARVRVEVIAPEHAAGARTVAYRRDSLDVALSGSP